MDRSSILQIRSPIQGMENGNPGFEDGIDVDCLLVEPQDGHAAMDSGLCFNQSISTDVMDMEKVSRGFGASTAGTGRVVEDILNGDVHPMHSEVDLGYLRLRNDFCSVGDEYLLGVDFDENIRNLDYGSGEGLQSSVSESLVMESCSSIHAPWKADIFRTMEVPECLNDQLSIDCTGYCDIRHQCHEPEQVAEKKSFESISSRALQDVSKFHDISSCSFQDVLSDEIETSFSPSAEILCSSKNDVNVEVGLTGQHSVETDGFHEKSLVAVPVPAQSTSSETLPVQKRSRKPTQRYIDELSDPIVRHYKKRRITSSPFPKDRLLEVKDRKKCPAESRALKQPAEEPSVIAIQVPFGSLVHKDSPKSRKSSAHDSPGFPDRGYEMAKSKDSHDKPKNIQRSAVDVQVKKKNHSATAADRKIRNDHVTESPSKKQDYSAIAAARKKRNDNLTESPLKKKGDIATAADQKKRNDHLTESPLKKKDDHLANPSRKKRNERAVAVIPTKRDIWVTDESHEEVNGRRKHHILWTITEVKQLIDGVSKFGVGRWSRIKKHFFSTSTHRTSVDLKDKWRNLLKASGIIGQGKHKGDGKRNQAWRPLPKSIVRRVCELAAIHPYPKGQKQKIPMATKYVGHASPDRSIDITLKDYRRILRNIDDD